MPRAKKPPGAAVDKRNGQRADLSVITGSVSRMDPPEGLCETSVQAWNEFWDDRPALLLTPSARTVLLRWVDALDRYHRTIAEADRSPLVEGSTGQMVANPLYRIAEQALSTVEKCEKQLGIGGLNAAALGLAAISERKSLAEMNARYGGAGGSGADEGEGGDEEDPRLRIIEC